MANNVLDRDVVRQKMGQIQEHLQSIEGMTASTQAFFDEYAQVSKAPRAISLAGTFGNIADATKQARKAGEQTQEAADRYIKDFRATAGFDD